jgi:hypothetical protein
MVFAMMVLVWVVFICLEIKTCILHLLILREQFIAIDKNPIGALKCEHIKKLGGFASMDISVKADHRELQKKER